RGAQLARGGELGARLYDARDQHGHHRVAFRTAPGGEQRLEAQAAQGAQHRGDMTMGAGAVGGGGGGGSEGGEVAAEHGAQGVYLGWGPVGEIGEGPLAGAEAFAPALAQEDGGARVAVGDRLDIHGHMIALSALTVRLFVTIYMG